MTDTDIGGQARHYAQAFRDIASYDAALARQIEDLQKARGQIAQLRAQLASAPARPCPFCSGSQRDLSAVIESAAVFGYLGGTYSSLESASGYTGLVPRRWECQNCGAFDVDPPGDGPRTWSRAEPPSPRSVASKILGAFAPADGVALIEDTHGTHWMLLVAGTWHVLPGTSSEVMDRLRSRGGS